MLLDSKFLTDYGGHGVFGELIVTGPVKKTNSFFYGPPRVLVPCSQGPATRSYLEPNSFHPLKPVCATRKHAEFLHSAHTACSCVLCGS
jgi:hypothetical protein